MAFNVGSGDLNSGPHVCATSTLAMDLEALWGVIPFSKDMNSDRGSCLKNGFFLFQMLVAGWLGFWFLNYSGFVCRSGSISLLCPEKLTIPKAEHKAVCSGQAGQC